MAAHLPTLFTIWIGFAVDWNRGSLTTSRVKGINFLFLLFQIPRALFKSCANVFLSFFAYKVKTLDLRGSQE